MGARQPARQSPSRRHGQPPCPVGQAQEGAAAVPCGPQVPPAARQASAVRAARQRANFSVRAGVLQRPVVGSDAGAEAGADASPAAGRASAGATFVAPVPPSRAAGADEPAHPTTTTSSTHEVRTGRP